MADSALQEALKDHGSMFSGLLGLLPAKIYYGDDQTNPYGKKKLTKAERAAAKRGRLDPDSALNRSAKEELDERESKKRKLRELEEEDKAIDDVESNQSSDIEGVEKEAPQEGLKVVREESKKKKHKTDKVEKEEEKEGSTEKTEKQLMKEAKKAAKKEAKKARSAEKKSRRAAKLAAWAAQAAEAGDQDEAKQDVNMEEAPPAERQPKKSKEKSKRKDRTEAKVSAHETADVEQVETSRDVESTEAVITKEAVKPKKEKPSKPQPIPEAEVAIEATSEAVDEPQPADNPAGDSHAGASNASSPSSDPKSPTFDSAEPTTQTALSNETASTTTSVSSTVPPSEKPKHITLPEDMDSFRERFQARMAALKIQRKAPGTGDRPARSRKELMEQRRQKEAERKARKKEERQKTKLEEERKREEALAANSPSAMSPAAELDETTANFSFGRVTFNDSTQLSHDLSYVLNRDKKKGPSDPKTALLKLQNQKKRLAEMGEDKRDDVEDKEAWLTARRRAEGDSIRDDETLLKKAVKRKERQKKKSEKEWSERASAVGMAQKAKQKKREDNIQKRKDEKVMRKMGMKPKKGMKAGKGRPGFEGSGFGGGKKKMGSK